MTHPSLPCVEMIRQRAELLRDLRSFFDGRGFLEVQPPCLSRDCVIDAYIDPIAIASEQLQIAEDLPLQMFLQTSPELAMKRMLAAGAPSIYAIVPVFRGGESGDHHNVEFSMLEWYEVGADIDDCIRTLGQLASTVLGSDGYDVKNYRTVFSEFLGFDPILVSTDDLARHVQPIDTDLAASIAGDRDMMLDVVLSNLIQPKLGLDRPLIIKNYPISQAALARQAKDDPQCAARFELIVGGIELANGYDELTDADVLVQRAQQSNQLRIASGRTPLRVESSLVEAMRIGLPKCAGVAMGVDRLLMIRAGETSLQRVLPFKIGQA
ncbi:Elongation factor P--(R)-beta-lysine ligase [Rubripirellula lacrimiformis]|uniref:Elongation factor P--(R)-beta-lysine ligase n=1 Tax=Rubripirellula lacrimiformis TaxID=1930273 RepID=A0A517N436_9BACT|nr:EF-P lysine aminoacylase EpmA [Rubripirellula lacrimiformis]QDT01894.1 Elongation factor P--(R)-beta-lysine ligase [Rubripirellula lacrimiformis]